MTAFLASSGSPPKAGVRRMGCGRILRDGASRLLRMSGWRVECKPSTSSFRHRLADHRRSRPPHHPRCGDRRGWRQDRRGRQVGGDRQELHRQEHRQRPQHRGDAGLRRLPSAFVVPAFARTGRRGQRAVVPVRPHVSLRGRARRRRRARVGDARRHRTAQARRHLLHRSRQLPSGVLGRGRDVDRHPHDRVALLVRPDQVGAGPPARADDREHRDRARARRGGAGEIRQVRQSAARRQRLVPRAQQRLRRTDRRPRQARQEIRHAAADPRLLLLFDARFQHRPRRPRRDRAAGQARRARRAHAGGALRLARAAGGGDAGQAQAFAGLRAVVEPAQRLRQFRRRQAAGADGARRQRRDRLRPRLLRHRRHDAGGAARLLLLQGDAAQSARHAAGDRRRDGDDQRRQGGADGRPHRLASRSARRPTSCCSTPSARNGSR